MDIYIALIILCVTCLIVCIACWQSSMEIKLLLIILSTGVFVYSGLGIAYDSVDNKYMLPYFLFLTVLLITIKAVCNSRIRFVFGSSNKLDSEMSISDQLDASIDGMETIINLFTVLFFACYLLNMVYPTNRILSLFDITNFTSYAIHARRIEHNSYFLLKISDMLAVATLPFFFIYLYKCAIGEKKDKIKGFLLSMLWIWLVFGKYNYLSRYEMVIYFGFIVMYCLVCKYQKILIDKKTVILIILVSIVLIPFMVNFVNLRHGLQATDLTISEALDELIASECYYPEYYDTCINNAGLINPLDFILWIVFLPIPSALWSGKPVVQIAYAFTGLFTSNAVTADNYSNLLPSVLGEAFLIFGPYWYWIEALILGVVIGLYFRFFLQSKKLSLLTAYMLLMLATIGRGGSQSYVSVIINGSIILILWVFLSKRIKIKPKQ